MNSFTNYLFVFGKDDVSFSYCYQYMYQSFNHGMSTRIVDKMPFHESSNDPCLSHITSDNLITSDENIMVDSEPLLVDSFHRGQHVIIRCGLSEAVLLEPCTDSLGLHGNDLVLIHVAG